MPALIVVFDTSCLLCSRFIQMLLKFDGDQLQYTGFDSSFSHQYLPLELLEEPETVVFYQDGRISIKSKAVMDILKFTSWRYRWLRIFRIFPDAFLNLIYDWIARNRYSWFGQSTECFVPTGETKAKFLD